jgi:hypothetical protein
LTFVSGEFRAVDPPGEAQPVPAPDASGALVAIMTGTMMAVRDRPGVVD